MSYSINRLLSAVTLGAAICSSGAAWGTTVEVLAIGDSTTAGFRSDTSGDANPSSQDHDLGGYRFYLDQNLGLNPNFAGTTFDFVGNRTQGTGTSGFSDNQHWGVYGSEASLDKTGNLGDGDGSTIPSTLTGISNAGPTSSINAAFNTNLTNPDAVLLGIGINSLPRRYNDLAGSGTVEQRIETTLNNAVGQFVQLLDGDVGTSRTGLIDRLGDNAYFASDAHLFVSLIMPRTDTVPGATANDQAVYERQPTIAADYNNRVKTELESRMGPGGALEGKVTFVDMFSITLAELDLQALADEFFSGEADPLQALKDAINPESEGGTDATDYVDWVYNASFSFDESNYENGTLPVIEELVDPTGGNNNAMLMRDALHPTNLGYAINAQVWENALEAHYIPEPSSLLLMLGGGMLAVSRRRRAR